MPVNGANDLPWWAIVLIVLLLCGVCFAEVVCAWLFDTRQEHYEDYLERKRKGDDRG